LGRTTSGIYIDTLIGANNNGCDSIRTLNLTVNPKTFSTVNETICQGFSFLGRTTSGIYIDTLIGANSYGCDSIRTLNLTIKKSSSSTFKTSACGSYFWTAKNKTYTSSNNIDTVKLINASGCDSIVTLNLIVYSIPNPTIIKTGNILSTQSFKTYQWLLNAVNIIGAANQSYIVAISGNYQVTVTDSNNCVGSSSVGAVIVSSLNEVDKDCFNIYPNPSEKLLNIETSEPEEWNAVITDSKGAQIKQIQFQKSTQLDINNYAPGVYYIQLTSKEEVLNYKFIKK
jgi:hypothetical protein